MKLSDVGERGAIDVMAERYGMVTLDDCATIDDGDDVLIVTSDIVNDETHFPLGTTPRQMGWFIVAVNLSDIAGKGGRPLGILLSLGLPSSLDVDFLESLSEGAQACVTAYGAAIIGGDTKEMPSVTLCGMAIGRMHKDAYMRRVGAASGDLVCVTGSLGRAGAALHRLHDGPDDAALHDLLHVEPRVNVGMALAYTRAVHASMDISDGLAASLFQMARASQCGFAVDANKLPLASNATLEQGLYAGGDYELLFTMPSCRRDEVIDALQKIDCPVSVIGEVLKQDMVIRWDSEIVPLEHRGYEHFTDKGKTL